MAMITLNNSHILADDLIIDMTSVEKSKLKIVPVKKKIPKTVFNSLANALSQSMANGNEPVQIVLRLTLKDQSTKDILWNEEALIRNNLDYHKAIKEARELQQKIQESIQ